MKKLFKHMSIYGLGGIMTKAISFFLLPIYTRVLVPADYGTLELVYMVGSVIAILYGFMISSGYVREYYVNKDEEHRKILLSSTFWFAFISTIIILSLTFFFAGELSRLLFKFDYGDLFLKLIAISMAIHAHSMIFYNLLMVQEKSKKYISIQIITLLLTIGLTIYFIVFLRWSVKGVLIAQVIGNSIELLILSILLMRISIKQISLSAIKEMLKYSIPLIPLQLAAFVLNLSDRFFLQNYQNLDEVGLYSMGYRFASLVPLLAIIPLRAYSPYIFSLSDDTKKCKKTISDFSRYYVAYVLILTLVISMFSREVIVMVIDKNYYYGWTVVYLLCLSYAFYGISNVLSVGIDITKKTWLKAFSWIMAALVNIGLNFLLIPSYGMIGASIATSISYFFVIVLYIIALKYIYPIELQYTKFIVITVFTSLTYIISIYLNFTIILSVVSKFILLLIFLTILIVSGYFSKIELQKGKREILKVKEKFFLLLRSNFKKA